MGKDGGYKGDDGNAAGMSAGDDAAKPAKKVTEEEGIASARRLHSWYDEAHKRKEAQRAALKQEAVKGLTFRPVLATAAAKRDGANDTESGEGNFGDRLFDDG